MSKERNYPQLRTAKEQLRWLPEVRRELYKLIKHFAAVKAFHIESWKQSSGHPEPCEVCSAMNAKVSGIKSALRHFGGYPR